jgi:hypothetical protein
MCAFRRLFPAGLSLALLLAAASSDARAQEKFSGVPRDIDHIKNLAWSQVILQGKDSTDLIAQTSNERIVRVLLVAHSLKVEATVTHVEDASNPRKLTSASVPLPPPSNPEKGHVLAFSFNEADGYYRAEIVTELKKGDVFWTKNAQMQAILETAARQSIPIQEFAFDAQTKEITRGKVNVNVP